METKPINYHNNFFHNIITKTTGRRRHQPSRTRWSVTVRESKTTYVQFPACKRQNSQHTDSDEGDDESCERSSDDVHCGNNENWECDADANDDTSERVYRQRLKQIKSLRVSKCLENDRLDRSFSTDQNKERIGPQKKGFGVITMNASQRQMNPCATSVWLGVSCLLTAS